MYRKVWEHPVGADLVLERKAATAPAPRQHPRHPMWTQSKSDLRLVTRARIRMDHHVQGTLGRYGNFQVQKQVVLKPSSQRLAHSSACDWPNELLVFAKYSPQVGSVLKTALVSPIRFFPFHR